MSKNYWMKIFLALGVLFILCLGGFALYVDSQFEDKAVIAPTTVTQSESPSPSSSVEPKTAEAVQSKMQMLFDMTSAGNYDAIYDAYDNAVKELVTKADLIKLFETCNVKFVGVKYTISNVKINGDKAMFDVQIGLMPTTAVRTAIYEDGAWRYQMTPNGLKSLKNGVDAAIAHDKASGDC